MIKDFVAKKEEFYEIDSKASIIWIIGEYAEKIPEAETIIDSFIDSFLEDPVKV